MNTYGFTWWFKPKNHEYTKFKSIITELAEKYNTPLFEPHITLLGEIKLPENQISEKTQELVSAITQPEIKFSDFGFEDVHFRALFLKIIKNQEITDAGKKAREIVGKDPNENFIPHLSLLYGDIPQATKEGIATSHKDLLDLSFTADTIHLVESTGGEDTWKEIAKYHIS